MDRRSFVRFCCGASVAVVAGCNGNAIDSDEINPQLDFFVQVERTDTGWELTVRVRNTYDRDVSIHDITLLAFSATGEEVCREEIGDLTRQDPPDRTVSLTCESFPAIVSGTAAETPCDGANIQITYWVGDPEQVELSGENETILWESTYRECNEPLPPERVIEKVEETPGH